jgi:Protein of unknown function (DUF3592)
MPDQLGKYIAAAFVLAFCFLAWRAWQIKQASPQWPSVEGEITESRARPFNAQSGEPEAGKNDWMAEVRFRYSVQGVTHEGNRLQAFGRHYFSREEAEQALAPYPVGARVKVFHDPAQPEVSVLIPG